MSVPARRRQVVYGRERGLSARRACTLFKVARSALSYRSRKAVKDAPVIKRMRSLSREYPRYGYRRIRVFMGREGRVDCGKRRGCRFRVSGQGNVSLRLGRGRKRLRDRTKCGPTTSYSTAAPTASS